MGGCSFAFQLWALTTWSEEEWAVRCIQGIKQSRIDTSGITKHAAVNLCCNGSCTRCTWHAQTRAWGSSNDAKRGLGQCSGQSCFQDLIFTPHELKCKLFSLPLMLQEGRGWRASTIQRAAAALRCSGQPSQRGMGSAGPNRQRHTKMASGSAPGTGGGPRPVQEGEGAGFQG